MELARFAAGLLAAFVANATSLPAQQPSSSPEPQLEQRPFCRLLEDDKGGVLEVLIADYEKGGRRLSLFGCLHVADRSFYVDMQRRFEACDALLYELIGDPELRPYPGMELAEGEHWISMVQAGMGNGLKLQDQFSCMDYRPDNFVHADMDEFEWQTALAEAGRSELGELLRGGMPEPDPEMEKGREEIDVVAAMREGRGTAALRLVVARTMVTAEGASGEPTVVIHGRNERCLEVLQRQLAAGKQRLGIFYGAAHMQHLERRLCDDLGWKRVRETWVPAWDCRYASFPVAERGLRRKRWRAGRDLKKLLAAAEAFCVEHDGEDVSWAKLRAANGGKLPGRADGVDPWGRDYVLRVVDGEVQVRCLGSDGEAETEDDLVEGVGAGRRGK